MIDEIKFASVCWYFVFKVYVLIQYQDLSVIKKCPKVKVLTQTRRTIEITEVIMSTVVSYSKFCFALFLYRLTVKPQSVNSNYSGRATSSRANLFIKHLKREWPIKYKNSSLWKHWTLKQERSNSAKEIQVVLTHQSSSCFTSPREYAANRLLRINKL